MTQPFTEKAHTIIRPTLSPGDITIDATVGNGHDTLFLAQCVGATGQVFGFDVQEQALLKARKALDSPIHCRTPRGENSLVPAVTLFLADHAEMERHLPSEALGRISVVMFNLGYLPGGDHALTTMVPSTLAGIRAALRVLKVGGLLSVLAYPGHPTGATECTAVAELLANTSGELQHFRNENPRAPQLFLFRSTS